MKRWMIWLLSPAKGILSFLFPLSVKIEIALYISIINWTVMLFYKYLCSFWKRYSCMLLFLFSYHHLFIIFSSFFFFLSIGIFFSSLSITEKERKHHIIAVVFSLSLSSYSSLLSQPKILPASVHIHIYQSEEVRVLAHRFFFFSSCIGQI
jgi:hypothetical protein